MNLQGKQAITSELEDRVRSLIKGEPALLGHKEILELRRALRKENLYKACCASREAIAHYRSSLRRILALQRAPRGPRIASARVKAHNIMPCMREWVEARKEITVIPTPEQKDIQ